MLLNWQNVYVFISSTFNDMHAERDYLVKKVFPRLSEWCEKRKLRLIDIDLRWGITESDATGNKNAVKVCLDKIDQCRPFFICFIGQRYGWIPEINDVSAETMQCFPGIEETLKQGVSITELEIIHSTLNPFLKLDDSVKTKNHAPNDFVFFYKRSDSYLDELPMEPRYLRKIYLDSEDMTGNANVKDFLDQKKKNLLERIEKSGKPIHVYHTRWKTNLQTPEIRLPLKCTSLLEKNRARWKEEWFEYAQIRVEGLHIEENSPDFLKAEDFNRKLMSGRLSEFTCNKQKLADKIFADLVNAITARYANHTEVCNENDLQKELDQQEQFFSASHEGFIKRGEDFTEIEQYVADDFQGLCVLTAQAGLGKTTLLVNWIKDYQSRNLQAGDSIHFRFIGASDRSVSMHSLLYLLLREIKENTGKLDSEIPDEFDELLKTLPFLFEEIGRQGRTIIVIDAINQLDSGINAFHCLPRLLPKNIKLIVSFKRGDNDGEDLYNSLVRDETVRLIEIKAFNDQQDRKRLVKEYLNQYLKEMDDYLLDMLIQMPASKNPLFLKVALSELRIYGSFLNLEGKIKSMFGNSPTSAFESLLQRLENEPSESHIESAVAVPVIFGLLSHARSGLSLKEITQILLTETNLEDNERNNEAASEFVVQLLRQVKSFLGRRDGRYYFFYDSFRLASLNRYSGNFTNNSRKAHHLQEWHRILAFYFRSLPTTMIGNTICIRKISELPFHLMQGKEWSQLQDTLTSFDFIVAKLKAGMVYELMEDYNAACRLEEIPENERQVIEQYGQYVKSRRHVLSKFPELIYQDAYNTLAADSKVWEKASEVIAEMESKNKPWIKKIYTTHGISSTLLQSIDQEKQSEINTIVLSRDGKLIYAGDRSGFIKIWEIDTGKRQKIFKAHDSAIESIAISPDEHFLVSAGGGKNPVLKIWDLKSGLCKNTLSGHTGTIKVVLVSKDSKRAISGAWDNTIRVWDLNSGLCLKTINSGKTGISAMDHVSGEIYAATGGGDNLLKIFDLEKETVVEMKYPHKSNVNAIAVTPDHKKAITGSWDDCVKIWDIESGLMVMGLYGHKGLVFAVGVSPEGKYAVTGGWDKTVRLWDLSTGKCLKVMEGHTVTVLSVKFSFAGSIVVSAGLDGIRVWDPFAQNTEEVKKHFNYVINLFYKNDGKHVVSTGIDDSIFTWDAETGKIVSSFKSSLSPIFLTKPLPDENKMMIGQGEPYREGPFNIGIFDISTGELLMTLAGHTYLASELFITPNGKIAVSVAYSPGHENPGEIKAWKLSNGSCLWTMSGKSFRFEKVHVTPNCERILVRGDSHNSYMVMDTLTGKVIQKFKFKEETSYAVSFTTDSRCALIGDWDSRIFIWDLKENKVRNILKPADHKGGIQNLKAMPDEKTIIARYSDDSILLWDLSSGCTLKQIDLERQIFIREITRDGRYLFLEDHEGTIELWSIETGKILARYHVDTKISSWCLSPDETRIAIGDALGNVYFLQIQNMDFGGRAIAKNEIKTAGWKFWKK